MVLGCWEIIRNWYHCAIADSHMVWKFGQITMGERRELVQIYGETGSVFSSFIFQCIDEVLVVYDYLPN